MQGEGEGEGVEGASGRGVRTHALQGTWNSGKLLGENYQKRLSNDLLGSPKNVSQTTHKLCKSIPIVGLYPVLHPLDDIFQEGPTARTREGVLV